MNRKVICGQLHTAPIHNVWKSLKMSQIPTLLSQKMFEQKNPYLTPQVQLRPILKWKWFIFWWFSIIVQISLWSLESLVGWHKDSYLRVDRRIKRRWKSKLLPSFSVSCLMIHLWSLSLFHCVINDSERSFIRSLPSLCRSLCGELEVVHLRPLLLKAIGKVEWKNYFCGSQRRFNTAAASSTFNEVDKNFIVFKPAKKKKGNQKIRFYYLLKRNG